MEELLKKLQFIGLTENESRVYLDLYTRGESTGYEIAKNTGVPRANVYSSLSNMVEKGFVRKIEGNPVKLIALNVDEVSSNIQAKVKETLEYLSVHMPDKVESSAPFITVEGDRNIIDKVKYMIDQAQNTIYLDAWAEDIHFLEEALTNAQSRGRKVVVVSVGHISSDIGIIYGHGREKNWRKSGIRPIRLITDSREVLTGELGNQGGSKAIYSENNSLVDLAKEAMVHEIMLMEIKKEFGAKLAEKFGEDLVVLIRKISGK